jgi:ankyrin repeat protein
LKLPALERVIRDRLGKLPKNLEKAYDEIYAKIEAQEKDVREIADRAFQWVMCSCTPLSTAELIAAVCQDPETDTVNSVDDMDMATILSACQNLLVVDSQLDVCRFSHLSVQEYIENRLWSQSQANATVAKVCLSLLNDPIQLVRARQSPLWNKCEGDEEDEEDEDKSENEKEDITGIVRYAMLHWPTHVQRHGEENIDTRLATLLKQFLGSMKESAPAYRAWHRMTCDYFLDNLGKDAKYDLPLYFTYQELIPSSTASFAICRFGFHETLSDWWESGCVNVEERNHRGKSLLQLAAAGGFASVAEELLKMGADINALGADPSSALAAASYFGKDTIVKLLLEAGADVNVQGGYFGSALQAVSHTSNDTIVKLLLEAGADINVQGGYFGSALQAASYTGDDTAVKLLLEAGADVNVQGGYFGSALQAASRGNDTTVKLLLEAGADVNAQGGHYGSALQAASNGGNDTIVKLLLEAGADVDAQGGFLGSALQAASSKGNDTTVELLLEAGADVNAQGGHYGSALQAASYCGNDAIVKLLLEAGADVNIQGGPFGSALQAAPRRGNDTIVKLLLEAGTDVKMPDSLTLGP